MLVKFRGAFCLTAMLMVANAAEALEIALVGTIGTRAILVVDGGAPQTIPVGGRSREGVRVLRVDGDLLSYEFEGQRRSSRLGEHVVHAATTEGGEQVALQADSRGHFVTRGRLNGAATELLVDTGATFVSLGRSDAVRAGIDYATGTPGMSTTANGTVRVWRHKLDMLEIGPLSVRNVDVVVHEQDLPIVLLGMSFLNRMDWRQEGDKLLLKKRY